MANVLVLGGSGMLGGSLAAQFRECGHQVVTVARHKADMLVDLTDEDLLAAAISKIEPEIIINSAALVSLDRCEKEPLFAWKVNAKAVCLLVNYAKKKKCKLVQISTDHYYTGDKYKVHKEADSVCLLNEYARMKYAAECFALSLPGSLVIRTNVAGFRRDFGTNTFAQWLFDSIRNEREIILFDDFYTSTIDTTFFSRVLVDLLDAGYSGVLNVASRTVSSKKEFAEVVAQQLGCSLDQAKVGSVKELAVTRAESLGLDVTRVTALLGYEMPSLEQVVASLVKEYRHEI